MADLFTSSLPFRTCVVRSHVIACSVPLATTESRMQQMPPKYVVQGDRNCILGTLFLPSLSITEYFLSIVFLLDAIHCQFPSHQTQSKKGTSGRQGRVLASHFSY